MVTYKKALWNGNKMQVESAIRDGNGVRIDTNYVKNADLNTLLEDYQLQHIVHTVTLASADWTNGSQTVTVEGVTDKNTVIVAPGDGYEAACMNAGLGVSVQDTDELTFTCTAAPSGKLMVKVVILPGEGEPVSGFKFTMSFDATTFKTDPTGCLTYEDDCAGYTPVSNPPSSLGTCQTLGSWTYNNDGTSSNPLLNACFYATFHDNGSGALCLHEKLNPNNLAQKIATWNNTTKEWEPASGASSITTEDTMFCIPTIYESSTATRVSLSSRSTDGTAWAHTIEGHTYDYLAIGVYKAARPESGASSKGTFSGKTYANDPYLGPDTGSYSYTIQNGHGLYWNFHQWQLWRIMTFFAMKSFDGQTRIGVGFAGTDMYRTGTTGLTDNMGPFAGSSEASPHVKSFIEDPWGVNVELVSDTLTAGHSGNPLVMIGQNIIPISEFRPETEFTNAYYFNEGVGYFNQISTEFPVWGIPPAFDVFADGSSSTGLCDTVGAYSSESKPLTAGSIGYVYEIGLQGPSCLHYLEVYTDPITYRIAYVFDINSE